MSDATGEDLVLTQLLWIHPGQEAAFLAFEDLVLPLLARHGGELLLRVRPDAASVVAGSLEPPYEIHLVRFPDEAGLRAYLQDEARTRALPLKEASVRSLLLFRGQRA